jgi:transcriptional regulator with XRE-family HTH domain
MQEPSEQQPTGQLGAWLQETREAQGLSLEEIEDQTRIRRVFLEALEKEQYDQLPGEVYVRGFLRNYALYLGLDAEEARRRYGRDTLGQRPQQSIQEETGFRPIDAELEHTGRSISTLVTRIALVLLLLAGAMGLATWYWYGCPLPRPPAWWPPRIDALLPRAIPIQSLTALAPAELSGTLIPSVNTVTPTVASPDLPAPARAAATSAVLPLPTPSSVPTATPTPTSTPLPAPPQHQGVELRAEAIERSWVLVTTDGRVDFQGTLEAGEERTWQAESSIAFRCGNAGGVVITINGEELGTLGERGQVVDQAWIAQEDEIAVATPSSP